MARETELPVETTSFVGRTRELAALAALLAGERLVTLTGVGASASPGSRCGPRRRPGRHSRTAHGSRRPQAGEPQLVAARAALERTIRAAIGDPA
ncbi:hypothetical protein [Streptomyces longispororuber]|uniref:hypothetical protein n=1 Tax=Streptomyces longispororuber TaxID=68230 RepID=UPI00210CF71B|nr:hypothetical protein [Streptomyces longispororuber]MCQ4206944.1 hypothetical protein [Streptomyces longispororuber]